MMNCIKTRLERDDGLSDISPWSERNFTCSFCRREFRSAQALGGHMNVHRRDRARLRLLPPNTILPSSSSEFSPYPNPKFLSSSLSTYMSTPSSGSSDKKATKHLDGAFLNTKRGSSTARDYDMIRGFAYKHHRGDDFNKVVKKEEKHMSKVRVDHVNMSLQLVQDPNKEEVDLELRLGHL